MQINLHVSKNKFSTRSVDINFNQFEFYLHSTVSSIFELYNFPVPSYLFVLELWIVKSCGRKNIINVSVNVFDQNYLNISDKCIQLNNHINLVTPICFSGFLGSLQDPTFNFVFWFGLSLNRLDGTWRWASIDHAVSWNDWNSGEPGTAYAENSACLKFSVFRWNGAFGSDRKPHMCEYDNISTEQTMPGGVY